MYQHAMPQYLPPPVQNQHVQQPMHESHCLVVRVAAGEDTAYDADSDDDDCSDAESAEGDVTSDLQALGPRNYA